MLYKVAVKNTRGRNLVGHLHQTKSNSIIIMCHGFTSDKSSRGRFDRLADAYNTIGYNVLTFDFSGCGESEDDVLTVEKQIDDLRSVIEWVKEKNFMHIGLYGHSLGSYICLAVADKKVGTVVVTGALTERMFYKWEDYFTNAQLKELEENGHFVLPVKQEHRDHIIIGQKMLDFYSSIDQEYLLSHVHCPVMILHGDGDEEERQLLKNTKKGLKYLPKESVLEVISGAPHNFMEHTDEVVRISTRWYLQHLPR